VNPNYYSLSPQLSYLCVRYSALPPSPRSASVADQHPPSIVVRRRLCRAIQVHRLQITSRCGSIWKLCANFAATTTTLCLRRRPASAINRRTSSIKSLSLALGEFEKLVSLRVLFFSLPFWFDYVALIFLSIMNCNNLSFVVSFFMIRYSCIVDFWILNCASSLNLFSSQTSLAITCGFPKGEPCCVVLLFAPPSPNHLRQVIYL